ncbi:MAG: hypothetical protein LBP61_05590, partial [Desulfovibrio sp.]|nr:hypothetical protein [Desulfovibrio sp.]
MPNDLIPPSPDIADADDNDDVVDLLKIVKPGKTISPNGAALKKEDDFSADLEAMLGQIAEEEETRKTAEPPSPFPDPTPVDHAVDPDETLNMPSM